MSKLNDYITICYIVGSVQAEKKKKSRPYN